MYIYTNNHWTLKQQRTQEMPPHFVSFQIRKSQVYSHYT